MHLVDEQNGLFALTHQSLMGTAQHLAKILDAGRDGGEFLVLPPGLLRDYMGQCCLAHTRRAEQNHRARGGERTRRGGVGETTQWGTRRKHMALPHHLIEGGRAHTHRQRSHHVFGWVARREQVVRHVIAHRQQCNHYNEFEQMFDVMVCPSCSSTSIATEYGCAGVRNEHGRGR